MSTEWGIFNDDSIDYTDAECIECGFSSYEEALKRLVEIRKEYGYDDDDCIIHVVEEAEEEELEEEPEDEEE